MGVLEAWERAKKCKFGLMRSKLPTLGRAGSQLACLLSVRGLRTESLCQTQEGIEPQMPLYLSLSDEVAYLLQEAAYIEGSNLGFRIPLREEDKTWVSYGLLLV